MSVGRNDLCPCGSGKKYKHCCLKKEDKKALLAKRREQFYEDKHDLVEKIGDYLATQVPLKVYDDLKEKFQERTGHKIEEDIEESYFTFWMYFFHRFENGLRGIEWFYQNNAEKLNESELALLKNWLTLKPRLLQAVDQTEEIVFFKDLISKERFPVSKDEENVAQIYPWVTTLALIEAFDDLYYFNGLRFNLAPFHSRNVLEKIDEIKASEPLSETEIMVKYYPEMLNSFLTLAEAHQGEIEVAEYSLTYHLKNPTIVSEFLKAQDDMRVEEWADDKKEFVWAGNWRICKDNACPSDITLADAYGNLFLQDDTLIFVGIDESEQQRMKTRLEELGDDLELTSEDKKVIGHYPAKPSSVLVIMSEMAPEYFTFYAQNDLLREMDAPIQMYGGKSIRDLMAIGEVDEAEAWLKDLEFSVYRQVMQQFEEVEVTADFNTLRRSLDLPLSPFVTGGSERETIFEEIKPQHDRDKIYETDIPHLEALGFKPDSIDNFYARDMLRFYKEMASKYPDYETDYKETLSLVRRFLEKSEMTSWHYDEDVYWQDLVADAEESAKKIVWELLFWVGKQRGTSVEDLLEK